MVESITPPLKWHGGKHYLAPKIVGLMPRHLHYVEPFFGGGAVLLAKDPEGVSEVVNDLHGDLTHFWRVLQDESAFQRFARIVDAVPFSEVEWREAKAANSTDPVRRAVDFFIRCRQSRAGVCKEFAPLSRTRTRRNMNEQASAWLNAVEGLHAVATRLKRVVVFNRPACEAIATQDGEGTLFYLDPPYLHETRTATDAYAFEMTKQDHGELLDQLQSVKGKVLLSGYRSALYDRRLKSWNRHEFDLPNNSAGGASKRRMVECVWCNF